MRITSFLITFILLSRITLSQDTIINTHSYKTVSNRNFSRDEVLFKILKEKNFDYWEYRHVYDVPMNDGTADSIDYIPSTIYKYDVFERGEYKRVQDSIQLTKINCIHGFWWIPPTGGELYVVTITSNQPDSIVNREDLLELLVPFNSLDKIQLYFDKYVPLKVLINKGNIELIAYDRDKPIRDYENKNGQFNVFEKIYLRIQDDGSLYKKRIGEYHLKASIPYLIT